MNATLRKLRKVSLALSHADTHARTHTQTDARARAHTHAVTSAEINSENPLPEGISSNELFKLIPSHSLAAAAAAGPAAPQPPNKSV